MVPRLVGVVVGRCGGANLVLEARQGDAVDAHVAVHADVPSNSFSITFDQKVSHTRVRPEVSGVAHLDIAVCLANASALLADALFEDAGKEEVGEDHDALRAEFAAAIQRGPRHPAASC